jgi:hypothetical protein
LTGLAGVAAVAEVAGKLDLVRTLDRGIGPIKQRDRGATGGQLMFAPSPSCWARMPWSDWTDTGRTRP